MAFREQTIGALLEARQTASELLRVESESGDRLTLQQTLVLQAASHFLLTQNVLYAAPLAHLTEMDASNVLDHLQEFTSRGIIENSDQQIAAKPGRRPKLYVPTELGIRVFAIFQAGSER